MVNELIVGQGEESYPYLLLSTMGEAWQVDYIPSFRRLAWPGLWWEGRGHF